MALNVIGAKLVAIVAVGIGSFVIGLCPACFTSPGGNRKLFLSSLLCFGAGVLLATSMLHILPEVKETLPEYAELVFCGGFLLLYFVDEVVHFFWGEGIEPHNHESRKNTTDAFKNSLDHGHVRGSHCEDDHQEHLHNDCQVDYRGPSSSAGRPIHHGYLDLTHEPKSKSTIPFHGTNNQHAFYGSIPGDQASALNVPERCSGEEETLLCHGPHTEPCANTKTALVGLLVALTIHALLEGLAIGLQTDATEVLLLLGAVSAHKFVVSFCLGIELATEAGSFCKHTVAITVFSGGSSLGIALGMLVSQDQESNSEVVMAALQALAGGTLLYVTVSEVLPRERAQWHRSNLRSAGIVQLSAVCCGFVLMFFLTKYIKS